MKTTIKTVTMFMIATAMIATSCKKDDPKDPDPTPTAEIIQGEISGTLNLDASKKYLLRGKVYILNGATINIPAGTIVMGEKSTDGTLIVNRGGVINAIGTPDKPIIFTSEAPKSFRNRGDWGGVVICGNSTNNAGNSSTIEGITGVPGSENGLYGPGPSGVPNLTQNSGTMKFCRIEFAGIDLSQDNELNSLTMGSVGSGTTIENIVVSYANDDAYEWFGGTNNHKYLIAYSTLDDDFDSDRGYSGMVQYGLIIRQPGVADISTSRAFEASSNNSATATPQSSAKFANITVMGPRLYRPANQISGFFGACVEINSNSNIEVHNSILTGFPTGARLNNSGPDALITGNVFAENGTLTATGGSSTFPANFETVNIVNATKDQIWGAGAVFNDGASGAAVTPLLPAASSPYNTGAPNLSAAGFEAQPFYGAFTNTPHAGWHWGAKWIEFDPINADY